MRPPLRAPLCLSLARAGRLSRGGPRRCRSCGWLLGLLFMLGLPLAAQQAPAGLPDPGAAAAPYPGIEEMPADTGRMRPGWHDFSRYPWAGQLTMCLSAAQTALGRGWRHGERDTAYESVNTAAPLPPAVRQVAERCGLLALLPAAEQVVLRGEGPDGGTDLFGSAYSAAQLFGRDSEAAALLRAAVAHAPTRAAQFSVVAGVYGMDLTRHPLRPALLERDAALAESLYAHSTAGDSLPAYVNATPRSFFVSVVLHAREAVCQHWRKVGDTAQARAAAERYITSITPLRASISPSSGLDRTVDMFGMLLELAILEHGLRSKEVVAVLTRMTRYETQDSTARGKVPPFLLYIGKPFVWPATPYWYSAQGTPVPPPAQGGTSPAAAIVPGKVTLIWAPGSEDHRMLGGGAYDYAKTVGYLHKLLPKYMPQGLQFVVLEHNRGMTRGVGAVDVEQEAPAIRQLYQEQFQLPAAVVVDTVRYRTLPDGRRNDAFTDWERRYWPAPLPEYRPCSPIVDCYPPRMYLVDKQGKIWMFANDGNNEDPLLEAFIQQALNKP